MPSGCACVGAAMAAGAAGAVLAAVLGLRCSGTTGGRCCFLSTTCVSASRHAELPKERGCRGAGRRQHDAVSGGSWRRRQSGGGPLLELRPARSPPPDPASVRSPASIQGLGAGKPTAGAPMRRRPSPAACLASHLCPHQCRGGSHCPLNGLDRPHLLPLVTQHAAALYACRQAPSTLPFIAPIIMTVPLALARACTLCKPALAAKPARAAPRGCVCKCGSVHADIGEVLLTPTDIASRIAEVGK